MIYIGSDWLCFVFFSTRPISFFFCSFFTSISIFNDARIHQILLFCSGISTSTFFLSLYTRRRYTFTYSPESHRKIAFQISERIKLYYPRILPITKSYTRRSQSTPRAKPPRPQRSISPPIHTYILYLRDFFAYSRELAHCPRSTADKQAFELASLPVTFSIYYRAPPPAVLSCGCISAGGLRG